MSCEADTTAAEADGLHIDADRVHADANFASTDFEKVSLRRSPCFRVLDTRQEGLQIVVRLETDLVVLAQIPHQVGIVGQHPQHLPVRKRNVQEKADGPAEPLLAQIAAQRNELVVVDPDRVVRLQ